MKARVSVAALAVAVLALGVSAGDNGYHDCDVCKPMMEEPGLMQHVRWEGKKIATGMITVTSVDPHYTEAFDRAHEKMMQNVARIQRGEKLALCPMCERMGALHQAGATIENLNVGGSHITVVTATTPELIGKIHAHHAWATEQFGEHHDGDHGHDHDHDHGG